MADSIIAGNAYLDRMRNMGDNNCLRDIYTQAYQAGCRFLYLNLKLNVHIYFFNRNEAMSAAFDRAHLHYEQRNGLVGMTKKVFLFFDSVTIDLEKATDPEVRKQSYSTKTHRNGVVSTGIGVL